MTRNDLSCRRVITVRMRFLGEEIDNSEVASSVNF